MGWDIGSEYRQDIPAVFREPEDLEVTPSEMELIEWMEKNRQFTRSS
jgi:hypothetical protein